jgi:two-component system, sensor histidine kinase and response regulator
MAKKILIVEDDSITRKSLQVALLNAGFEADEAPNGVIGLEKALATHPDIVLADIIMPELDGFGMIKKLREDSWGKSARVIILTSNESADAVNKALELGVYTYFSKDMMDASEIAEQIAQTTTQ